MYLITLTLKVIGLLLADPRSATLPALKTDFPALWGRIHGD
jgi:hypothetical protein